MKSWESGGGALHELVTVVLRMLSKLMAHLAPGDGVDGIEQAKSGATSTSH